MVTSLKRLTNLGFEYLLLFHSSGRREESRCQRPLVWSPTSGTSTGARSTFWPLLHPRGTSSGYYFCPRTWGLSSRDMDSCRHKTILARMAFSTRKYETCPTFYFRLRFGVEKIWTPRNHLGIQGFARQLIDCLSLHYEKNGDVCPCSSPLIGQTPTIFVAHSLGGLVVKKVH